MIIITINKIVIMILILIDTGINININLLKRGCEQKLRTRNYTRRCRMFSYEERNKAVNLTNTIRFKLYRCYIICELDYPARESLRN
jgi:hypothetical protein